MSAGEDAMGPVEDPSRALAELPRVAPLGPRPSDPKQRLADLERAFEDLRQAHERLVEAVSSKVLSTVLHSLQDRDARRNRSSPTIRDMTDDDARAVLVGDHRALNHKEAARVLGLSYSQVYSCRLGHTFKHVHKELRGSWKNPWVR